MSDTTADILRKAKALISDPANWNQDGDYFEGRNESSICMCVYGAISKAQNIAKYEEFETTEADDFIKSATAEIIGFPFVATYNDRQATTHADIMALFDSAIQLAEASQ